MRSPLKGPPLGQAANFKILLLVIALACVLGLLFYSQRITDDLLEHERQIVDLYAKSLEYTASDKTPSGDFSFVFSEIIQTIDFPIILADPQNKPVYFRNLQYDSTMTEAEKERYFADLITDMDRLNRPIRITYRDSIVLNHIHYGESTLIRELRWLPYMEIALAGVFLLVAYMGFSYIKRSEQSNIWVGMAKETAHQLGTPLSSIMGWLERVKEDAGTNPRLQESVAEMAQDLERLNKVTARFSKIGSKPDLKEENVVTVINDVIRYISKRIPKSGKRVDLVIETPGDFPAMINRELFEWVIENLMKNALDAIDGPSGRISFAITQSGAKTIIDVTDTGKGIEPKFHNEVFRPGYSTKKRGWGLGLSLSRRIIGDYHKGRLFVKHSAVGAGTTFRIQLVK
jgi:signal transduction histidine kinase